MNADALIAQLQIFSGGAMVMSTAQLASCLSMNPKVISRMRQEKRFPIREKMIGAKIVYTLDTVASYLLGEDEFSPPQQTYAKPQVHPEKKRATRQAPVQDLSLKMLRLAFVSNLENQIKAMEQIAVFFTRKVASDDLEEALPIRYGERPSSRPVRP